MAGPDSLWPDSFDAEGNKTDWRYDPALECLVSPSTSDVMYRLTNNPPVKQQIAWVQRHPDAIRLTAGTNSPASPEAPPSPESHQP